MFKVATSPSREEWIQAIRYALAFYESGGGWVQGYWGEWNNGMKVLMRGSLTNYTGEPPRYLCADAAVYWGAFLVHPGEDPVSQEQRQKVAWAASNALATVVGMPLMLWSDQEGITEKNVIDLLKSF